MRVLRINCPNFVEKVRGREREKGDLRWTYIVSAEGSHYFARAVELDFDALVEVLGDDCVKFLGEGKNRGAEVGAPFSVLAVLEAWWMCGLRRDLMLEDV